MRNNILVVLLLFSVHLFGQSLTNVDVTGGKIEGYTEDSITVFKGIPFAAPPVGELRWKAPQPVNPWDSILKTNHFAPACPQITFLKNINMSEDCLFLNVWTPAYSADEKLPVMVWIYGGGFAMGSTDSPIYDGINMAKKGVILVTVAYRVGVFGFLAHPWLSAESPNGVSGNYGLLDQIAGLKWVQENISAFGGDPTKVTVFGESAGGISVSMLCASPLCKGLFRAAICESGGSFGTIRDDQVLGGIQNLSSAEKNGTDFTNRIKVLSLDSLRKMDFKKFKKDKIINMGETWPVVDGYVITDDQYKLYKAGKYNDVDILIGTNSDEGSMFVKPVSVKEYRKTLKESVGEDYYEQALKTYPAKKRKETFKAQSDFARDMTFAWPTWAWATLQSETGKGNVYMYYFTYPQKMSNLMRVNSGGAGHGSEMRFVFQNLKDNATEQDKLLAETMISYWTNFAKTGNPNGLGLPYWPIFQEGKLSIQYLDIPVKTDVVPNKEGIMFMDDFFKSIRE